MTVLLVAHRTPASAAHCARWAAAGAKVFEVDVRLHPSHGGRVAVTHFLPLPGGRLQRDKWRLRWHSTAVRDPALADVDAVVPPECTVLLDVKESRPERRRDLLEVLAEALPERHRYVVCSPQPEDLDRARTAGFRTWRTIRGPRDFAAAVARGRLLDEAVSVRHSLLDRTSLERLKGVTELVVAWTVNDLRRADRLRAWGVDGVTSDRVAVIQSLAVRE